MEVAKTLQLKSSTLHSSKNDKVSDLVHNNVWCKWIKYSWNSQQWRKGFGLNYTTPWYLESSADYSRSASLHSVENHLNPSLYSHFSTPLTPQRISAVFLAAILSWEKDLFKECASLSKPIHILPHSGFIRHRDSWSQIWLNECTSQSLLWKAGGVGGLVIWSHLLICDR